MVSTLKLSDIISKWRDALQASPAIQAYCLEKYNKAPQIFVGTNGKAQPADTDYPLVVLYPGSKTEGLELPEYTYKIAVGWTIRQQAKVVSGNITEYQGVTECDDLGQLIYLELAQVSPDNPISEMNYHIEPVAYYPCFPGRMDLTLKITPVNGYSINY